jgi:hypothetical protein
MKNLKNEYLEKLQSVERLKLVIVGQDPYLYGANGIAFCKDTFSELEHAKCCGKDVLKSLGIDLVESKMRFENPVELFMGLLDQGIAFINVNHELFTVNSDVEQFKGYNNQFLSKADKIVVLGLSAAKTAFNQCYSEYRNVSFLIHPSGRNQFSMPDQWNAVWASTYLKNNYLTNNN